MVVEIDEEYIVQVVTDNDSNYKKAWEELMKSTSPNKFQVICQIFIDSLRNHENNVKHVVKAAQNITRYIYNHTLVLRWMRDLYDDKILRLAITRFATNYIALDGLLKRRDELKQMFRSEK
ncbi:hypothetical protein Taro_041185 [Colocasia esculenta]|uniref:Uncharacterized protein n=1 Tax=Colocasia esculenta TaxID=4460 RepID=A0A843WDQ0_COLES|nr:hypothetical protein [Colocasia esculenta]